MREAGELEAVLCSSELLLLFCNYSLRGYIRSVLSVWRQYFFFTIWTSCSQWLPTKLISFSLSFSGKISVTPACRGNGWSQSHCGIWFCVPGTLQFVGDAALLFLFFFLCSTWQAWWETSSLCSLWLLTLTCTPPYISCWLTSLFLMWEFALLQPPKWFMAFSENTKPSFLGGV